MDYRDLEAVHSITPELLVDTMAEGVVVLDTEFRICLWNPAMSAMTGYSPAEALGFGKSRFQSQAMHHQPGRSARVQPTR